MRYRQFTTIVAAASLAAVAVVSAGTLQPPPAGKSSVVTITGPVVLTTAVRDAAHGYPFNASTLELAKQG